MDTYKYLPTREYGNIQASIDYFLRYNVPTSCPLLDIGTHRGSFIAGIEHYGYTNTIGIDMHPDIIEYGRQLYPSVASQLHAYDGFILPFDQGSFGVVTMFDVLEHITDPYAFLQQVHRVLQPNGMLIFQTPNKITNIPWEIARRKSLTSWKDAHVSLQTLPSLRRLLRSTGFVHTRIDKYNIETAYNIKKVKDVLGRPGLMLLRAATKAPLWLYPNFWGSSQKSDRSVGER